jgi:hypothetical protein
MVLRRQVGDRVHLTNFDRLLLVQLYHWFPSIRRRLIYEDRGTRISIMARMNQGPDTLQQTGSRPTRKKSTWKWLQAVRSLRTDEPRTNGACDYHKDQQTYT